MKNLSLWPRLVVSFLTLILSPIVFAGGIDLPMPADRIKLGFSVAYAHQNRSQIAYGRSHSTTEMSPESTGAYGFNNSSAYDSYSIGAFAWLPMMSWEGFDFHAVLGLDHIPGANVSAGVNRVEQGDVDVEVSDAMFIKSHRTDFKAGVNVVKTFRDNFFFEAMLAGGISRYHIRGENVVLNEVNDDDEITVSLPSAEGDHPGVSSTTPFFNVELALGKHLTEKSHAFIFINYTVSRRDHTINLSGRGDDDMRIDVTVPKHWTQVGVAFIRELNL